jgi:hypothetical protein
MAGAQTPTPVSASGRQVHGTLGVRARVTAAAGAWQQSVVVWPGRLRLPVACRLSPASCSPFRGHGQWASQSVSGPALTPNAPSTSLPSIQFVASSRRAQAETAAPFLAGIAFATVVPIGTRNAARSWPPGFGRGWLAQADLRRPPWRKRCLLCPAPGLHDRRSPRSRLSRGPRSSRWPPPSPPCSPALLAPAASPARAGHGCPSPWHLPGRPPTHIRPPRRALPPSRNRLQASPAASLPLSQRPPQGGTPSPAQPSHTAARP